MTLRPASVLSASVVITLLAASGAFAQDHSSGMSPSPSASAVLSAPGVRDENTEFREINEIYSRGDYEGTIARLGEFQKHFPNSTLTGQVENLLGLSYLLTKRPQEAADHFKKAIARSTGNPTFMGFLEYNLAKALFAAGQTDEADQVLTKIQTENFDPDNLVKYHFLKSNILEKKGKDFEAARELLTATRALGDKIPADTRASFQTHLADLLPKIQEISSLQDLYLEFEGSSLADQLLFSLGSQEMSLGKPGLAETHLRTLLSKYPSSPFAERAQALLKQGAGNAEVDPMAVGVLLPMKGKFAKFGSRVLQSIELAFGVFDHSRPDNRITLIVQDSGDDPDQAIQALNQLVTRHHVIGVIGPLLSKGIDQVTRRAEELGVPMISLARHTGTPGRYVLQGGMTLQLQSYEIARQAIQKFGMKNFAILAPKDKIGEEASQHFWDAVELYGGKIVGMETYPGGETDFRQVVDKLAGLYYTEARQDELNALAEQRKQLNIKKKTRKTEQYFNLKPIIDFQGVFIPDEPKIVSQIMPTFAYRDVDGVKFLGPSAWNSPEFVQRAQNYAEQALFVDAFVAESAAPASRKFVESYQGTFSEQPTAMEALAFDAALILEQGMKDSATRADLLEHLTSVRGFNGITGKITYQEGNFLRDLKALRVKKGLIQEAAEQ